MAWSSEQNNWSSEQNNWSSEQNNVISGGGTYTYKYFLGQGSTLTDWNCDTVI